MIVIQARTGSTRLPGKVLADIGGVPLLSMLVGRLQTTTLGGPILVATTDLPADDAVTELALARGVRVYRGHPTDVLTRFQDAARAEAADVIVRISADSPFLDGGSVDEVMTAFAAGGADIVQNHRRPGWPIGTAIEVFSTATLERLATLAQEARVREHVTLYAYEHPAEFTTGWVPPPPQVSAPGASLVVDDAEDLERARRIQAQLGAHDRPLAEVVAVARGLQ
jgi:spore coat polysaccharide biosynthesis protein SpsF (cytidylyltransferase family)